MRLRLITSVVLVGILGSALSCPDDKYCLACGTNDKGSPFCNYCQDSFVNVKTGQCDPNIGPKIDKCIQYQKNGDNVVCDFCEWGYRPDSVSGTCIKCEVVGCASCVKMVCTACSNGILLQTSNHTCDPNYRVPIPNCNVSRNSGEPSCAECNEGYTLNFKSQICLKDIGNCLIVQNSIIPKCDMCRLGYYAALDGTCKPATSFIHRLIMYSFGVVVIVGAAFVIWKCTSKKNSSKEMLDPTL